MKRVLALLVLSVLLFDTAACGGGGRGVLAPGKANVHGTWVNEADSSEYFELKQDGTYFLKEGGIGYSGEWEIENNTITIHVGETGVAARATLKDGKILDEDGKVWVKGEPESETADLTGLAERACEDMSAVSGSDDWQIYNQAEERASRAGFTTSELDDAVRELCPDIFSEYVDNQ